MYDGYNLVYTYFAVKIYKYKPPKIQTGGCVLGAPVLDPPLNINYI